MVKSNGTDRNAMPIQPWSIYQSGNSKKSLHVSCRVAEKGVTTPDGLEKATTEFLGEADCERMVFELRNSVPLMIELQVGPNFSAYNGTDIYRLQGPRSLHAVCIVGYGTYALTGEPYWLAKNSYGPRWGKQGYALILWNDRDVEPQASVYAMRGVTP